MDLILMSDKVSTELWCATLVLREKGKSNNSRDFIVNVQQLAFLKTLVDCWPSDKSNRSTAKPSQAGEGAKEQR